MLVLRAHVGVKTVPNMVALTLFRIIRAYSLKNSKKCFFFSIFSPFGVFKPYEYTNFVSKPFAKYFYGKTVFCSS